MSDLNKDVVTRSQVKPVVVKLRPTLFVALGGTGMQVVLRLRRRILQNDWGGDRGGSLRISDLTRFPIASFVYFDTDMTEAVESNRAKRLDPLARMIAFKDSERLQKKLDAWNYMKELDNYPHIRDWLPEGDLASIPAGEGAGQVRSISRLLFFDQFSTFQQMVRDQGNAVLNNVGRQNELAELSLDIEHQLRVVVICSAAGGTGSGSFIDAGLAIRSMLDPKPAQVDLMLFLPGGFRDAGQQRVNANTFAALMELEHVMRPNAAPPYVDRWTRNGDGPLVDTPYNEVYLLDTRNVTGDRTDRIADIYDMVADVLFEDFGSSDFSARKRSISANTKQYKIVSYFPPLSDRLGPRSLSYSCAYSSFGQATIVTKGQAALDTAVIEACKAMVKAYFNVALKDSGRLPTPDERIAFLGENFHLVSTSFEETLAGVADDSSINEPALIGELLKLPSGDGVVDNLGEQIFRDYQEEILGSGDLRNWATLALKIFEQRRDDVIGTMSHNADVGPSGAQVVATRQRMTRRLKGDGDDGLRAVLFRYLDNRARGGLDYTIKLVEDSKVEMEEETRRLAEVQHRYEQRAGQVRERFNRSIENLKQAARPRLLGSDRKAAERYLEHLRNETVYYVKLRLRAQACAEATRLLKDVSEDLGTPRGVNADGHTVWEGALGALVQGRRHVEQILGSFDDEITLLRDAVGRENAGVYVVLPDADAEVEALMRIAPNEIEEWASGIFDDEGGSRTLFPKLEDEAKRSVLLAKLRGYARHQLLPRAERLRSVHDILLAMTPRNRVEIFRKAMRRAMPWINARFDRLSGNLLMTDRYKLFVAVEEINSFERDFKTELREAIPSGQLGFSQCEIVNSGLRNRLVIYCELSGIPLDTLVSLNDEWRRCYRLERREPLPLHNHRTAVRFANPVVPTNNEIEEIRATMGLFLKAVCFGILERGAGSEAPFLFHRGHGDRVEVGTERDIRAEGFAAGTSQLIDIRAAVERFERSLEAIQFLAASALLEWTGRRAYASRMERIRENVSDRIPGLMQLVAVEIANTYLARFKAMQADNFAQPEQARAALQKAVSSWTREIVGSVEDTDPMDASRDPSDLPGQRAVDKRAIIPAQFTPMELQSILDAAISGEAQGTTNLMVSAPARNVQAVAVPLLEANQWFLSTRKQVSGPFGIAKMTELALHNSLEEATNVLAVGSKQWVKVRDVPQLKELLTILIPEDEDDPLADANLPPD